MYQKTESDCQRCVLAFLLGKNYEEVPDFTEGLDKWKMTADDRALFDSRLDNYLSSVGLFRLSLKIEFLEGKVVLPYSSKTPLRVLGVLKKEERPFSHAVVLELTNNKATIVFDPNKNSDYVINDISYVEYIVRGFDK